MNEIDYEIHGISAIFRLLRWKHEKHKERTENNRQSIKIEWKSIIGIISWMSKIFFQKNIKNLRLMPSFQL